MRSDSRTTLKRAYTRTKGVCKGLLRCASTHERLLRWNDRRCGIITRLAFAKCIDVTNGLGSAYNVKISLAWFLRSAFRYGAISVRGCAAVLQPETRFTSSTWHVQCPRSET